MDVPKTALRLLLFSLLVSLVGCASAPRSISKSQRSDFAEFDQLPLGISSAEVVKLLGQPVAKTSADTWVYKGKSSQALALTFDQNSKVTDKALELSNSHVTLANLERRYHVRDLAFVSTANKCGGPKDPLGSDIYYSKQLGAQIAVSLKGDLQRVELAQNLKEAPAQVSSETNCRALLR